MRDKLNNNPIAQVVVVAILLAAGAYFLLGGGGGSGSATTPTTATVPGTTPAPATTTPATTPATGTAVSGDPTAAGAVPATAAAGPLPVPPLPAPVRRAYAGGQTVVLLIVRGGGVDDALVGPVVHRLQGLGGVAVFITRAKGIARYAAITLGVNVNRAPALVVVRPRQLSAGTPQATVSYGFQSPTAIVQAVIDASYNGPSETYHPN